MRRTTFCAALSAACLVLLPFRAHAQRKIECESQAGRRTMCEADTRGGVYLHERESAAPCTYGRTWGYTGSAVWVSDGCRAEFIVDLPPVVAPQRPLSAADALRVCRNAAAARLGLTDPSAVRIDVQPPDAQGGRAIGWSIGRRSGTCRVSATGQVTGWTVRTQR
ncbi:MAG TPA: DUF3011 domain-containing protein [Longimicrobium sp.]